MKWKLRSLSLNLINPVQSTRGGMVCTFALPEWWAPWLLGPSSWATSPIDNLSRSSCRSVQTLTGACLKWEINCLEHRLCWWLAGELSGTCMFMRLSEYLHHENFSDHLLSVNGITCFRLSWHHSVVTVELCLVGPLWKQVGTLNLQLYSEKLLDKKHVKWSKQSRMEVRRNQLNLI